MKRKGIIYVCSGLCLLALAAFVLQPVLGAIGEKDQQEEEVNVAPEVKVVFNADSAYQFCADQCQFGPRAMNTEAHDKCGEWIKAKFRQYGCEVESQKADLKGWDGKTLKSENIIARLHPEAQHRILLCAHWDSRPWADNDPDEKNQHTPVMAANDAASGVAVMLEIARALHNDTTLTDTGIDFVCFDAEDYGMPQWTGEQDDESWALGAQYWSKDVAGKMNDPRYNYEYGILLDMVGGEGEKFYMEGMSMHYAPAIVDKVWQMASDCGYGSFFPKEAGGNITDDHIPVNTIANIPCIDIIPYFPDCEQSSFGPTWHTVNDTMEHIDRNTLKAVGQTIIQLL